MMIQVRRTLKKYPQCQTAKLITGNKKKQKHTCECVHKYTLKYAHDITELANLKKLKSILCYKTYICKRHPELFLSIAGTLNLRLRQVSKNTILHSYHSFHYFITHNRENFTVGKTGAKRHSREKILIKIVHVSNPTFSPNIFAGGKWLSKAMTRRKQIFVLLFHTSI